jgi:hypothetical protein
MSKVKIEGNASGTGTLTIAAPNTNSDYSVTLPEVTGGEFVVTDSSGNVLVGKTSSSINTAGHTLFPTGYADHVRDGDVCLRLNRQTSDGEIVNFRKDGSTVGSIGADSGDLYIGTGDTGVRFRDAGDDILPFNTSTGADRDAAVDLGDASSRFKDLYLSGGVYLGGTGSANHLDDYEEGTWTVTTTTGTVNGIAHGKYTKVGNVVHAQIFVQGISDTTSSNVLEFSLPFAAVNYTTHDSFTGSVMIRYVNTPNNEIQSMSSYISGGQSVARVYYFTDGASYNPVTHNLCSTLIGARISITYQTS